MGSLIQRYLSHSRGLRKRTGDIVDILIGQIHTDVDEGSLSPGSGKVRRTAGGPGGSSGASGRNESLAGTGCRMEARSWAATLPLTSLFGASEFDWTRHE